MIKADNLKKRYGNIAAVGGVSFAVEKGETFGLLGPNGAGKTTTIQLLCGLLKPDGGTVSLGGKTDQESGRGSFIFGCGSAGIGDIRRAFGPPESAFLWKDVWIKRSTVE